MNQCIKRIANLVRTFLGKEGQGALKAHMVRGTVGTFAIKVVNTVLVFGTSLLLAWLLGRDRKPFGIAAQGGLRCTTFDQSLPKGRGA